MQEGNTEEARSSMLRAAVAKVGRQEMRAALASAAEPGRGAPKAAVNALHALRKHRDPVGAVGRPPYRAALPWVAAAIADDCLTRTIEELGEASEDPDRQQLLAAIDRVRAGYSDVTIAVMLATVAGAQMPASDLCFEILSDDDRFGLTELSGSAPTPEAESVDNDGDGPTTARSGRTDTATPAQREARRLRKRQEAEARRKRLEVSRLAADQARRARRHGRSGPAGGPGPGDGGPAVASAPSTPRLTRRALLSPSESEEFDAGDPWVAGVVVAWVPFGSDPGAESHEPGVEGKERPCVVVAGSPENLLVRPGYSDGGAKSRDWRSVPLRQWRSAGFDRPTWIDFQTCRIPRQGVLPPRTWLVPDDWNALW